MPLTLKRGTGDGPPVGGHDIVVHIRCDYCEEPLDPAVGGTALWKPAPRKSHHDVAYLHRDCRESYAGQRGADFEELDLAAFLDAAIHNLEVAG